MFYKEYNQLTMQELCEDFDSPGNSWL